MLKIIDDFLNRITMYKLVLYYLVALWVIAFILSFFGVGGFTALSMAISLLILIGVSFVANYVFSKVFEVPANVESIYITAFILALIVNPATSSPEYFFLVWAAVLSMASKYIFAINHKHIFNPAAFAVVVTSFFIGQSASWWVGTLTMLPFVLIGGLMIVRKIKRTDLSLGYFIAALATMLALTIFKGGDILNTLERALLYSPLFFFSFIMITEPLTTPPRRYLRILYGVLVGFLFAPEVHIGTLYFTPELALLVGNVFSYLISPKKRLTLKFKKKIELAPNTDEIIFATDKSLYFEPGQYLEWTLGHQNPDSRGNRRYFTIASSPTEKELMLGVKFYDNPSSFKTALKDMTEGDTIIASQLSGDFILPKDKKQKLVFIAGGIGITPFRSMIKYLVDRGEKRDIILIYVNRTDNDIAYKDILDSAANVLNIKIVYMVNESKNNTLNSRMKIGRIDGNLIKEEVKDFNERTFYISGPPSLVSGVETIIEGLGVSKRKIKTDFFPGFA